MISSLATNLGFARAYLAVPESDICCSGEAVRPPAGLCETARRFTPRLPRRPPGARSGSADRVRDEGPVRRLIAEALVGCRLVGRRLVVESGVRGGQNSPLASEAPLGVGAAGTV